MDTNKVKKRIKVLSAACYTFIALGIVFIVSGGLLSIFLSDITYFIVLGIFALILLISMAFITNRWTKQKNVLSALEMINSKKEIKRPIDLLCAEYINGNLKTVLQQLFDKRIDLFMEPDGKHIGIYLKGKKGKYFIETDFEETYMDFRISLDECEDGKEIKYSEITNNDKAQTVDLIVDRVKKEIESAVNSGINGNQL